MRTSDQDVERYLKLFTFIPLPEIENLMAEQQKDPSKRVAQHALARDFVELIHGRIEAEKVAKEHRQAFVPGASPLATKGTQPSDPNQPQSKSGFWNPAADPLAPHTTFESMPSHHCVLPESLVYGQLFNKILWSAGMVASKGEAHRIIINRGAYVGSRPGDSGKMQDALSYTPIKTWTKDKAQEFIVAGNLLILRIGKWKVKIVKIISDKEFEAQGLTAPGWKEEEEGDEGSESPAEPTKPEKRESK